jgi:hypothetical protein
MNMHEYTFGWDSNVFCQPCTYLLVKKGRIKGTFALRSWRINASIYGDYLFVFWKCKDWIRVDSSPSSTGIPRDAF